MNSLHSEKSHLSCCYFSSGAALPQRNGTNMLTTGVCGEWLCRGDLCFFFTEGIRGNLKCANLILLLYMMFSFFCLVAFLLNLLLIISNVFTDYEALWNLLSKKHIKHSLLFSEVFCHFKYKCQSLYFSDWAAVSPSTMKSYPHLLSTYGTLLLD